MNLEQLQARQAELAQAVTNMTNQVYILQGHKAEVDYHLSEALKAQEEAQKVVATLVESPVE